MYGYTPCLIPANQLSRLKSHVQRFMVGICTYPYVNVTECFGSNFRTTKIVSRLLLLSVKWKD